MSPWLEDDLGWLMHKAHCREDRCGPRGKRCDCPCHEGGFADRIKTERDETALAAEIGREQLVTAMEAFAAAATALNGGGDHDRAMEMLAISVAGAVLSVAHSLHELLERRLGLL